MTETLTTQLTQYLHQLGWEDYHAAFTTLLQHFEGTELWLDDEEHESLPYCLLTWLAALSAPDAKPMPLALFAIRHWSIVAFRASIADQRWDYRQQSFQAFCGDTPDSDIKVSFHYRNHLHTPGFSLAQAVGFLRKHHCQSLGKTA